jgi:hypothetical protein
MVRLRVGEVDWDNWWDGVPCSEAMGTSVAALVAVIAELNIQINRLEAQLGQGFDQHPDAKVVRSLPGLGTVLGARVLAEFGDDPNRYVDAKARKNYAGTSPITKASGKSKVVLARYARNRRLADACYLWAFAALNVSPGARAFYEPIGAYRPGRPASTWSSPTPIWSRSATAARPNFLGIRVGHRHSLGEARGRRGGDPERHSGPWPGGVRTHRCARHDPFSPARGQRTGPARR